MKHFRLNTGVAIAVDMGLAVAILSNVRAGAKVMRDGGVPFDTALRVLLHPAQRRNSEWYR